jgi:hypothetical protein
MIIESGRKETLPEKIACWINRVLCVAAVLMAIYGMINHGVFFR